MENCFIQIFRFGWSNGPSFIQVYFTAAEWSPYQGVSTLIGIHCIFHLAASLLAWSHQSHVRQKKLLEWHIDRRQEVEEGDERRIHFPLWEMVSHGRSRRDSILYLFSICTFCCFHANQDGGTTIQGGATIRKRSRREQADIKYDQNPRNKCV